MLAIFAAASSAHATDAPGDGGAWLRDAAKEQQRSVEDLGGRLARAGDGNVD